MVDYHLSGRDRAALRSARVKISLGVALMLTSIGLPLLAWGKFAELMHVLARGFGWLGRAAPVVSFDPRWLLLPAVAGLAYGAGTVAVGLRDEARVTRRTSCN